MMRLGFAVKTLGRANLKSNDSRRWQNSPHLRVSLEYLNEIFDYLSEVGVPMYRFSSDLAPYLTHPDLPQFRGQIEECRDDLIALGKRAKELDLRLSFHPSQYILLNSPSERLTDISIQDFAAQSTMLDLMEQGEEGVVVTHVGGVYGEKDAAMARWVQNFKRLPQHARRRIVLENDDESYGVKECLQIHEQTGVRLIFDHQHHTCINNGETHEDACCAVMKTWEGRGRPKIHYSSPRLEKRNIERRNKDTGERKIFEVDPLLAQHADYIDRDVFIPFAREIASRCGCGQGQTPFDVMIEAKAKDLALFQLRDDLLEHAPDLKLYGFTPAQLEASHRVRQELLDAERAVVQAKEDRVRLAQERKAEREQKSLDNAAKKLEREKAKKKAEALRKRRATLKAKAAAKKAEEKAAKAQEKAAPKSTPTGANADANGAHANGTIASESAPQVAENAAPHAEKIAA